MKILGKIALIFTGCFLLFAVIGNIALSFNGGVKASFQQVYDRLEEVWPYELFGRAEESLDQITDRLDPPQKAPDMAPAAPRILQAAKTPTRCRPAAYGKST